MPVQHQDPWTRLTILPLQLLLATTLLVGVSEAKTKATVTKADEFSEKRIQRTVFVTAACNDTLDCSDMESRIYEELSEASYSFEIVPESEVRKVLFEKGLAEYSSDLRGFLVDTLELDSIFEIEVPYSERGDGFGGKRRSMVKINLTLVDPEGKILMRGVGTGRPLNVVSSPERVAANVVKKILEEALD